MADHGHNLHAVIKRSSANGAVLTRVLFQNYCLSAEQQNNTTCLSCESGLTTKSTEVLQGSYVEVVLLTRSHYC